jgi:NAD(P)-dependent dehydrogenase (short-subunit alcohol dehydrogenase family)
MKNTELKDQNGAGHSKKRRPHPPFEEPPQEPPGLEASMHVQPDHGEKSYRGHGRLTGKTALITGGDSGIGRAVAIAFAREGADVAISFLKEEEADAQETKRWIEAAGRKGLVLAGDIRDEDHCRYLVERVVAKERKLDILVNNAAYQMTYGGIEDISAEELDRTFRTNIYAMFYLCKAAIPQMQPGSTIINTASIQAYQPNPSLLAYAATKAAIVNFTKGLAKMVTKQGIRANAVAPGPVWTPLIASTMPEQKTKNFGGDSQFERPAQPAELAPLYVFLACEDSSYVTGEVFGATGGRTPT